MDDPEFFLPRRCLREPIEIIADAAKVLSQAADAHLAGDGIFAGQLFRQTNIEAIRDWTDSIWGKHNQAILRIREIESAAPKKPPTTPRNPGAALRRQIVARDGFHCRFCGIPVIDKGIRDLLRVAYPEDVPWPNKTRGQHAALQCMWLQYDHVLPYERGGETSLENLVVTCAPCNFGRMSKTLEEVGLIDPRSRPVLKSDWDGLERIRGASLSNCLGS